MDRIGSAMDEGDLSDDESLVEETMAEQVETQRQNTRHQQKLPTHTFSNRYQPNSSVTTQDVLKTSLVKFYTKSEHLDKFLQVISTNSPSLRLLDYFVVTYTKLNPVTYMHPVTHKLFDVYSSYKTQLKSHSKRLFDPFKRNGRIVIRFDNEQHYSTLGQLHFFKWCLTNHVLDYVEKNMNAIIDFMKKDQTKKANMEAAPASSLPPVDFQKKKRQSRRRSALNYVCIRAPAPADGMERVILRFG